MTNHSIAMTIRAKKLGVLLRDARLASGKGIQECAAILEVSPATVEAYEFGERSPSLPELEVLAFYLDVPLDHFWGKKALSETSDSSGKPDLDQLVGLRQRVIGTLIRQARLKANMSLESVAGHLGYAPDRLDACELGEQAIPLPELEILSSVLDTPLKEFQDHHGPVGAKMAQQRAIHEFLDLSPDLQAFVCKPVNRPYLELAQRLSEMSVEKLRAVAEGLLEITL